MRIAQENATSYIIRDERKELSWLDRKREQQLARFEVWKNIWTGVAWWLVKMPAYYVMLWVEEKRDTKCCYFFSLLSSSLHSLLSFSFTKYSFFFLSWLTSFHRDAIPEMHLTSVLFFSKKIKRNVYTYKHAGIIKSFRKVQHVCLLCLLCLQGWNTRGVLQSVSMFLPLPRSSTKIQSTSFTRGDPEGRKWYRK